MSSDQIVMCAHKRAPWLPTCGCDDRCPSLYGPEQIQCTQRADEPHEWHTGSGTYPDDEPFGTPGEPYGAAWLSHWEPGLTDRTTQ